MHVNLSHNNEPKICPQETSSKYFNYPYCQIWTICFAFMKCVLHAVLLGLMSVCLWSLLLPDGACGWGQWRAKSPDVFFMLLHRGNADFEGRNVGQKRARGKRGLLLLSVLLRLQEWHKLDLDYCAGKTKHTPRKQDSRTERRWKQQDTRESKQTKSLISVFSPIQQLSIIPYCTTVTLLDLFKHFLRSYLADGVCPAVTEM